jgi:hypothetical protein
MREKDTRIGGFLPLGLILYLGHAAYQGIATWPILCGSLSFFSEMYVIHRGGREEREKLRGKELSSSLPRKSS